MSSRMQGDEDPRHGRSKEFKRLDGLNTKLEDSNIKIIKHLPLSLQDRDPASTLVSPAMRVRVGQRGAPTLHAALRVHMCRSII